jgi:hypothetical protein
LGKTVISKSRWQTDEFPINPEFFREMGRQGFGAKSFSGVMTSEQRLMPSSSAAIAVQCGASPVMKVSILGGSHAQEGIRLARFGK